MIKKILIPVGILFLVLFIFPFLFEGKIQNTVKEEINKRLNAELNFKDASLSLIRSFPNLSLHLKKVSIVRKSHFENDTINHVDDVFFNLKLTSLLKNEIEITSIKVKNAFFNLFVDAEGKNNYSDILKSEDKSNDNDDKNNENSFSLNVKSYTLQNFNLKYKDDFSKTEVEISDFDHKGKISLSQKKLDLDIDTKIGSVSFNMNKIAYLKKAKIKHDGAIQIDYAKDLKLNFQKNILKINNLSLSSEGDVTLLKDNYDLNLSFKSEKSEFKNLLSLIPSIYATNFSKLTTKGNFDLHGKVRGIYSNQIFPKMNIILKADHTALKYTDLNQPIENINFHVEIVNDKNTMDDIQFNLKKFEFKIAQDIFKAIGFVKNPISNPTVETNLKGTIDLKNLKNAYPIASDQNLKEIMKGIMECDINASFDLNSIKNKAYHKIKTNGNLTLEKTEIKSKFAPYPIFVKKMAVIFNNKNITLKKASLTTASSDLDLNGKIENFYEYIFSDSTIKSDLSISSNIFKIDDFYKKDTLSTQKVEAEDQFKIPKQIFIVAKLKANKIIYSDIHLHNFKSEIVVKDQKITLKEMKSDIFEGKISLNGTFDTQASISSFNFNTSLKGINITTAFDNLNTLQKIAPILKAFKGQLNTNLKLDGFLKNDLTPDLSKLDGQALLDLKIDDIDLGKNKFLNLTKNKIDFLNLDKPDIKNLILNIKFKDSKVTIDPFNFNFGNIPVTVKGNHSFNNEISYDFNLLIPAPYLAGKITSLFSEIDPNTNLKIPLNIYARGTSQQPEIRVGMEKSLSFLTKELLKNQKSKIKEATLDKLSEFFGIGKKEDKSKEEKSNETGENKAKNVGKKILKNLFGN